VFNTLSSADCDSALGSDSFEERANDRGLTNTRLAGDKNELALAL
jgi:hypothetical protein